MTITLTAQLPGGKNRIKERYVNGKKIRYPDKRFTQWRETAAKEILVQKSTWPTKLKMELPWRGPVSLEVSYCAQDKKLRDADGMLSALMHLLTYSEILEDDGQVKDLRWTRRVDGPCAVLTITTA
jgi:Holliday junction resolvase RusA-like endonuclease